MNRMRSSKLNSKEKEQTNEGKKKKSCSPDSLSSPALRNSVYGNAGLSEQEAYKIDQDLWLEHLFDQMIGDEGNDFYSNHFASHWESGGSVFYDSNGLQTMSEEEYAAYIRKGMYEKKHKHKLNKQREQQEARHQKFKEKEREKARIFLEEQERNQRRKEKRTLRRQMMMKEQREIYYTRWQNFDSNSQDIIKAKNIPWPIENVKEISKGNLDEFLFSGIENRKQKRTILRQEQIRFHPDRWLKWLGRMEPGKETQKIMDRVNEISRLLNTLWEEREKEQVQEMVHSN
ncbi:hypothetical protein G9A89_003616 [Geosiphon pyriformis]|nr:hypothetical protein G9A89_003616 [Geosiphon pyriformis]